MWERNRLMPSFLCLDAPSFPMVSVVHSLRSFGVQTTSPLCGQLFADSIFLRFSCLVATEFLVCVLLCLQRHRRTQLMLQ
jgi:hypothetical protein